jgi:hypothetical protein
MPPPAEQRDAHPRANHLVGALFRACACCSGQIGSLGNCRPVTPASIACRPDEKLATLLKERLQFSKVRHPFDREHRLD